ncbi:MAG: zinc-binding dehydrogenase [Planctomycetota bacterium]|jgi:threonine dehydrogenase-like Zn-dependent dehydrogenase|nr:zinc-binding dehydrogenase [Planctomycetota bacterium]
MAMGERARAMIIEEFNRPLRMRELPLPEPGPGEALVRMLAAGVCGSDVHIAKGEDIRVRAPLIPGHEGIGELVASGGTLGDIDGREVRPGDRIAWERGLSCGVCHFCVVLRDPALCRNRRTYGIHVPMDEPPHLNGCYASHIMLRRGAKLISLRDFPDMDPAVLVPACCSGATTAHGFDMRRPETGDTAVVQGPGPLGVFAVDLAKRAGARNIVVIGRESPRTAICRRLGATHILDRGATSPEERRARVRELTGGRGADWVYECAGTNAAVSEALGLARRGGAVLTAGIAVPTGEIAVDWFRIVNLMNLTVQGVWLSDTRHLRQALGLILDNPEPYAGLITHRFPLERANEALAAVERGETVKAALIP